MNNIIVKIVMAISSLFSFNSTVEIHGVKIDLVNSGSGLYEDKIEKGKYIYKGNNPNNYILFNNELWRIVSFESDGRIKIIRNESIGNMPFDENSNNFEKSSLKKYLNTVYYNNISDDFKTFIDNEITLISFNEYLKSNSNRLCNEENNYFKKNELCLNSSYLNKVIKNNKNNVAWTSTKDSVGVYHFGNIYFGDNQTYFNDYGVVPVLYLKSDIGLSGNGIFENIYKINL